MSTRYLICLIVPLTLVFTTVDLTPAKANPNTGPPTNLHRRFVVQQTKRKAAQGKSTRKNVGVWLSGGYDRTVSNARRSSTRNTYRTRRFRRR